MRTKTMQSIVVLLVVTTATCTNAKGAEEVRADIRATYDFEPSTMSFDEQARHAPELSKLWGRFDKDPDAYGATLRSELRAEGNRELLYCDGGMLLLAKSKTPEDQRLGLDSLRKCSLAEIQHTPYFYTLHRLAVQGADTFDLQARILTKPNYSVFIVQHALRLGQDYAYLYPFLVQDEAIYVPRLIGLLAGTRDATAQKSIIRALWYAATPEAEACIRAAASDDRLAPKAREDAQKLMQALKEARAWNDGEKSLEQVREILPDMFNAPATQLRERRRSRMRSISDEALYELEAYTLLIYRSRGGG